MILSPAATLLFLTGSAVFSTITPSVLGLMMVSVRCTTSLVGAEGSLPDDGFQPSSYLAWFTISFCVFDVFSFTFTLKVSSTLECAATERFVHCTQGLPEASVDRTPPLLALPST